MLQRLILLVSLVFWFGLSFAQMKMEEPPREPLSDNAALIQSVEKYVDDRVAEGLFSGVVLIAHNGTPLFHKAYGLADKEKNVRNAVDTRFNVGSISKTFTALAIHQLVEKGKLSLSDTLLNLLPDYPNKEAARKITVQHLLDMSSGVGDIFGEKFMNMPKEKLQTLSDYVPLFADKPLQFEPGTSRRYSNGGFIILGLVIEKLTGISYYDYVEQNIFIPAGMTASGWPAQGDDTPNKAVGYAIPPVSDGVQANTDLMPGRGSSAGGGFSTAMDLLSYTNALQKAVICSPEYRARGGLGIGGGAPGVNASLEWLPEQGYAVVVLANLDPPAAEEVAMKIVSWLPE